MWNYSPAIIIRHKASVLIGSKGDGTLQVKSYTIRIEATSVLGESRRQKLMVVASKQMI